MKIESYSYLTALLLLLTFGTDAFVSSPTSKSDKAIPLTSTTTTTRSTPKHVAARQTSRAEFVKSLVVGTLVASPAQPAFAGVDPSVKGTKKDPAYEACVSKCMYECTKPKVEGQKSRQECLPDCKKQCATTKEQLLLGAPKASS